MTTKKEKEITEGEIVEEEKKELEPVAESVPPVVKADIDSYIKIRQEFIKKVNAIMVDGKDYHIIQGKRSLAKGGAEKIASIFQWNASFSKDEESLSMLGEIAGLVAFKCSLSHNGAFIGEGRGAAVLDKNNGDPNKTLKMAQKSAFIDAVLRSSGLSDFFTQDLEDMPKGTVKAMPAKTDDEELRELSESEYCNACGQFINEEVASYSKKYFDKYLCRDCQKMEREDKL